MGFIFFNPALCGSLLVEHYRGAVCHKQRTTHWMPESLTNIFDTSTWQLKTSEIQKRLRKQKGFRSAAAWEPTGATQWHVCTKLRLLFCFTCLWQTKWLRLSVWAPSLVETHTCAACYAWTCYTDTERVSLDGQLLNIPTDRAVMYSHASFHQDWLDSAAASSQLKVDWSVCHNHPLPPQITPLKQRNGWQWELLMSDREKRKCIKGWWGRRELMEQVEMILRLPWKQTPLAHLCALWHFPLCNRWVVFRIDSRVAGSSALTHLFTDFFVETDNLCRASHSTFSSITYLSAIQWLIQL